MPDNNENNDMEDVNVVNQQKQDGGSLPTSEPRTQIFVRQSNFHKQYLHKSLAFLLKFVSYS